ncbi:hypothetical protein [Crossiella sp. CA198]|uniref:hypothetical protein n=1 Tax=Crossiella sp. CA198 TaxID=3455607 RepID=UPI003F8D8C10
MTVTEEPAQSDHHVDQTGLLDCLHWPTRTNPGTGERELLIGGQLGAIAMRAGLGAETNSVLSLHMLPVPVLGCPGRPEEWIFLTGPAGLSLRLTTLADLSRMSVCLIPRQTWLPLPPAEAPSRVRWVVPPLPGQTLAPWLSVISAVRSTSSVSSHRG